VRGPSLLFDAINIRRGKKMQKKSIGKIEKPTVESFRKGKRRLYLVPLVYPGSGLKKESQKEYGKKIEEYWEEVKNRIRDLEAKLGKINRIYHEMVCQGDREGAEVLKKLSQESYSIVQASLNRGSLLQATEDKELVRQSMDWARCLATNPQNGQVLAKLTEFYIQTMKRRDEYVGKKIDESLKSGEIGILFIREGMKVNFPSDIEIFRISPPALDDIHKFLEDLYLPSTKAKKKS
jgi:hypothetical protein